MGKEGGGFSSFMRETQGIMETIPASVAVVAGTGQKGFECGYIAIWHAAGVAASEAMAGHPQLVAHTMGIPFDQGSSSSSSSSASTKGATRKA
jgi:hypothetical protein